MALWHKAKATQANPIPIRKEWRQLHAMPDRRRCPPPLLIPMIIEGAFDDAWMMFHQMGLYLRLSLSTNMEYFFGKPIPPEAKEGKLPDELIRLFSKTFGVQYIRGCVLAKLAEPEKIYGGFPFSKEKPW